VESTRLSVDVPADVPDFIADTSVTTDPATAAACVDDIVAQSPAVTRSDVDRVSGDLRVEDIICDPVPMEIDEQEDDSIVWTVVEASSRQRHQKLTSSAGYSYNVKRRNKNGTVDWQCCRRERRAAGVLCRATVKQSGEGFGFVMSATATQHCNVSLHIMYVQWRRQNYCTSSIPHNSTPIITFKSVTTFNVKFNHLYI